MEELFADIPTGTKKNIVSFMDNVVLSQDKLIDAIYYLSLYSQACTDREREFLGFYLDLRAEGNANNE